MTTARPFGVCAFSLLICLGISAQDEATDRGDVEWRILGPGIVGANFAIGFHATNPKIMLGGTDMGGAYRTDDSGKSWRMVGSQRPGESQPGCSFGVWRAVFDPKRRNIAWLGAQFGAHKSTDGGVTWKRATKPITGSPMMIQSIGIDPTDPDIVYIGQGWVPRSVQSWVRGRVWKTLDGGATWEELARPGGTIEEDSLKARSYTNIIVDPNSPFEKGRGHARVYIFGRGGLFVSEDAGETWTSLANGLPHPEVDDMVLVNDAGRSTLFATSHAWATGEESRPWAGGMLRSDDNGRTWTPKCAGLERALRITAQRNGVRREAKGPSAVLLAHSPAAPNVLYAGCQIGIFRSDDQGETWRKVTKPNAQWVKVKDYDGSDTNYCLTRHGGNFINMFSIYSGIDQFHLLASAPSDPNYVAFTDNDTTRLTRDGGETWEDVMFEYGEPFDEGRFGDRPAMTYTHRIRSRGAQVIVCRDVAVDPFDPNTLAFAYADIGLRISRDNGAWWEHATRGILGHGSGRNQGYAIAYDPAVEGKAYVAVGHEGRVYVTEDRFRTFKLLGIKPLLDEAAGTKHKADRLTIWKLLIDPKSPVDRRTLYAGTAVGIYKSVDGGHTWSACSQGMAAARDIRQLVINPKNTKVLYAGSGHRARGKPPYGLYRSVDAGQRWELLAPDTIGPVWSVAICRSAPNTLYVVAGELGKPGLTWSKASLWRTDNAGDTWRRVDERRGACVAVHPLDPDRVYYATFAFDLNAEQVGVWRSTDGGRAWQPIAEDIPLSYPMNGLVFDATDPTRFFLLNGFCVYEGRDRGAPHGG